MIEDFPDKEEWEKLKKYYSPSAVMAIDSLLARAVEEERLAWLTGYRCIGCGVEQDNQLSDMCGKCLEEA